MPSLLIRDGTLVTDTALLKANVLVEDGVITRIEYLDDPDAALPFAPDVPVDRVMEAQGLLLFPGLIDCHVHFREPGLTHKATMASEAASARAGGVTTVCEMPNTIPPTVTVAALADKVRRAADITDCDIFFFFGVTAPAHLEALRELWTGESAELVRLRSRCCGVKLFLDHSTGNQRVSRALAEDVFKLCGELRIPLVAHCEDPEMNEESGKRSAVSGQRDVAAHSLMRPPESEAKAIAFAIDLAQKYKTPFHVAHLSTWQGIDLVRQAKAEGLSVTCEVTPHHLFLTTDDYATLGTFAKMNPPLRSMEHRDALWAGIVDGTVDCVSTDHAPHTAEEKHVPDPLQAPSGVPGVETMFPLLLTAFQGLWPHPSSVPPAQFALALPYLHRLCFARPNRIFGLQKRDISVGAPADFLLADPHAGWVLEGRALHSACGWTPFEGWHVHGKVREMISTR